MIWNSKADSAHCKSLNQTKKYVQNKISTDAKTHMHNI